MDGPRSSQESDRERQTPQGITYMWDLRQDTIKVIYKTETDSDMGTDFWLSRSKGAGEGWIWSQQIQTVIYRMDE